MVDQKNFHACCPKGGYGHPELYGPGNSNADALAEFKREEFKEAAGSRNLLATGEQYQQNWTT